MNFILIISYCIISFVAIQYINGSKHFKRQKRYLLFTRATQWGVFATIAIPIHPETTVSVAWFFEANYYNVDNSSYFEPLLGDIVVSREEKRSITSPKGVLTRSSLYTFIQNMLEKHGYPGEPCLLRSICESATSHFLHNGLLGDLLHLVLTPSTSMSEDDVPDVYYEAEYYGLHYDCDHYKHTCPESPLEYLSIEADRFL